MNEVIKTTDEYQSKAMIEIFLFYKRISKSLRGPNEKKQQRSEQLSLV